MRVVPVMDLKAGVVVHGVAGEREKYRAVESRWCKSADPISVAKGLQGAYGFEELYVADLDALQGAPPARTLYRAIAEQGFRLWIDAGLGSEARLAHLLDWQHADSVCARLIVPLESLESREALPNLAALVDHRGVFSLDLKRERAMTQVEAWREAPASTIAEAAWQAGFRQLLVLDLADVGSMGGVDRQVVRFAALRGPTWETLAVGGGVRGVEDLESLESAGATHALVATAIHRGAVMPEAVKGRWG